MDSEQRSTHDHRRELARAFACVLLACLGWLGSVVHGGFAYDDLEALRENPVVEGSAPWSAAFERDYWEHIGAAGHYRPLATLTLRADHRLHGIEDARGWHVTNLCLHLLVVASAACTWILLADSGKSGWPWLGLALFAVHPALSDAVAWISGRSSMLSALPPLLAACVMLLLLRARQPTGLARLLGVFALAGLGTMGALLGKEDGLLFALVLPAIAATRSPRAALAAGLGALGGLVVYASMRAAALGSPWPSAPAAPLADVPLVERLLVAGRAQVEGLRIFFWPLQHPPSYDSAAMFQAPGARSSALWWSLAALGLGSWALATGVLARNFLRTPRDPRAASSLCALLAIVPFLQLVPSGVVFAPRFLYLPLLFALPLLNAPLSWMAASRFRLLLPGLFLAALVGCWSRAQVYSSRRSFHRAVLEHRPQDARAWNELGLAEEEEGDLAGARLAFQRAGALDLSYGRPWSNLGRLELAEGRLEQAEVWLLRAVERGPANPVAHVNLGAARVQLRAWDGALDAYARALQLAPGMVPAWRGLARCHEELGQLEEAREALARALELSPGDPVARRRMERLQWALQDD